MSWASHPTTEMPAQVPPPSGRHRAGRRGLIGLVAGGVAVAVLAVIFFSGALDSSPDTGTALADPALGSSTGAGNDSGPDGNGQGAGAGAGAAGATAPSTVAGDTDAVVNSASLESDVFALTNAERATGGCPALRLDDNLAAAARDHSVEMANTGVFGHTGPDGSDPGARMTAAGYDTGAGWAENIARGQANPAAVLAAWMGSPDHRGNILNCGFVALGVGAARGVNGQLYWTQDFGGR
jgi:uncharacterized protein YkwD